MVHRSKSNITKITHPDGYYVERAYDELNRLSGLKLNGNKLMPSRLHMMRLRAEQA